MSKTVFDLLRDLHPSGDVYFRSVPFPKLLRLHKTSLLRTLGTMPSDLHINYELHNPEGTGRYSKPRRYIVVFR